MKALTTAPNLTEQVLEALLAEIASGRLAAGDRVLQEQVAQTLGVSRQPVQQALLLLRKQGVLRDAPGRGLEVAPLDPAEVRHMYELRAVVEGLAARRAAEGAAARAAAQGPALIEAGRKAAQAGSVAKMIAADMRFHEFLYDLSGNPLLAATMGTHWTAMQRVMGEVLTRDERPRDIWDQHAAILAAIAAGDAARAEKLAREHITLAAGYMVARLAQAAPDAATAAAPTAAKARAAQSRGTARGRPSRSIAT